MSSALLRSRIEVRDAIERLSRAADLRYGDSLIEVELGPSGLWGTVALSSQAAELRRRMAELWPEGRCRLLVLAARRPRVGLYPESEPLNIWRRRPDRDLLPPELTTQLLPGDPPAGLLAVRDGQYLVKAPGDAVGWVHRNSRYRLGKAKPADPAGMAVVPRSGWDPELVRETAVSLLGRPFVLGGTGGLGIDCSGLSWRAFLSAGVRLPRNSRAQRRVGERVPLAQLAELDLICAVHRGPKRTSHVALYLGQNEVIHACSECHQVLREPLAEFRERYQVLSVRRVPGAVRSSR
ncbi:MAG TPA: C40 family peptidase [Candidatus Dormibacteraeota bacterium]|nr:C40 family peptidase [Candidatus Dormibacteraeota bacterium]